ncbi:MAG: hypothetical protein CMC93_01200 [Flavobacteriaceae bacterium]|nr:hypothetical protein [Flavobacteriaceae bacterium]
MKKINNTNTPSILNSTSPLILVSSGEIHEDFIKEFEWITIFRNWNPTAMQLLFFIPYNSFLLSVD